MSTVFHQKSKRFSLDISSHIGRRYYWFSKLVAYTANNNWEKYKSIKPVYLFDDIWSDILYIYRSNQYINWGSALLPALQQLRCDRREGEEEGWPRRYPSRAPSVPVKRYSCGQSCCSPSSSPRRPSCWTPRRSRSQTRPRPTACPARSQLRSRPGLASPSACRAPAWSGGLRASCKESF